MRSISTMAAAVLLLMSTACGGGGGGPGGPTQQEIENSLDAILRSAGGDWIGVATAPTGMRLEFRLQEGSNGQLSGSGTMKEDSAPAAVPITITGTYQRPLLTLSFDGMVFQGQAVKGAAQGNYVTVGGIATALKLTAPGFSRDVPILFQEK